MVFLTGTQIITGGLMALSLILVSVNFIFFMKTRETLKNLKHSLSERTRENALQSATLTALIGSLPDYIITTDHNVPHNVSAENNDYEDFITDGDGNERLLRTIKKPLAQDGVTVAILSISRDITAERAARLSAAVQQQYTKTLSDALAKITKSPTISSGVLKDAADVITMEGCLALKTFRVNVWFTKGNNTGLENISCYNSHIEGHCFQADFDLTVLSEYAKLLQTERLIITNEIDEQSFYSEEYSRILCAGLDAPIRVDGRLMGVVCAEQNRNDEYPQRREWQSEEQAFVSSLADLMALAIACHQRRKARDEAQSANRTKSAFISNMCHEMRTPLSVIMGMTEIIYSNDHLPPDAADGLDKIATSSTHLLGIINDISDFSKIEANVLELYPAEYAVMDMVGGSVRQNIMRKNDKPIIFEQNVKDINHASLIGDEPRIRQILNNLLSNAFKYTEKGKVTLTAKTEPGKAGDTAILTLSVSDTGKGMTKEQLGKLFDEYSRFDKNSPMIGYGTGLGLAITQRLVGLMDGTIQVESAADVGSLFIIRLPQRIPESDGLLRSRLTAITEMCRSFNRKGALDLISEINPQDGGTKALMAKITSALHENDFEEAEKHTAEYTSLLG
jgi:signal transduction histidine kinase